MAMLITNQINNNCGIGIKREYYRSLDGLRAISCIGIMMMHILANTDYKVSGFLYKQLIPFFTQFVLLFLMISGFGMCAGYLQKFYDGSIDLEMFYKRRYKKLLPFFCFLIVIALIVEPCVTNFFDATIEVTLLYGLLPNNALNVIGVGWTIGVIFLFYLLFPAFTILLKTKKRAWFSLGIALWINFICSVHYFSEFYVNDLFTPRHSFIFCLPLFIAGGIVYLYRDVLKRICCSSLRWIFFVGCVMISVLYFFVPDSFGKFRMTFYKSLVLFSLWLSYFVGHESKLMTNIIMNFFSGISLELYLCHMFVFRALEKVGVVEKFMLLGGGVLARLYFSFVRCGLSNLWLQTGCSSYQETVFKEIPCHRKMIH